MHSTVSVYRDGKPVEGKKVTISISGILSGGHASGITDRSGCATISHASEGSAKVFVNGREVGHFHGPGCTSVDL